MTAGRLLGGGLVAASGRGLDLPDLIQEGNIGLMKAIERYDDRG